MRIRNVDWNRHLIRASEERVAGHTFPYENPSEHHRIWHVQNWKDNKPGKFYTVHIWHYGDPSDSRVSCNCIAAQNDKPCKHAAWVIAQEVDGYVMPMSKNSQDFHDMMDLFRQATR